MAEFKTGQWVICGDEYMQVIDKYYRRGYMTMRCRRAGTQEIVRYISAPKMLTLASLTPDFSKAEVGDMCFDVELETCVIDSIRETEESIMLMVDDGKGNLNPHMIPKEGYIHNPTLFHSFAQFQAYWAEKALEMGGEK